jgi:hypothetical protein
VRRFLLILLCAVLALTACTNEKAVKKEKTYYGNYGNRGAEATASATREFVGFRAPCHLSKIEAIDPIAHRTHLHMFWGNEDVTANATYNSLLDNETNCRRPSDKTAYWAPQIYWNGQALESDFMGAYYQTLGPMDASKTKPFPEGIKLLASEAKNVEWHCGIKQNGGNVVQEPPTHCDHPADGLGLRITFPSCWNGEKASDGPWDVVYPKQNGDCPADHSKQLPTLSIWPDYTGMQGQDGNITVSIGDGEIGDPSNMHADAFNVFDVDRLTNQCIVFPKTKDQARPEYCDGNKFFK